MKLAEKKLWFKDGTAGVSDPQKGLGLIWEDKPTLVWMVVSMFRRIDNGEASEPFIVHYGMN